MKNLSWLFFLLFLGICDILQSHFLRLFYCDISLTAIILQGSGSHITNYIFCLVGFNTTQQYDVGTELNTIMHVFRMVSFKQVQVTVLHVNISWSAKKKSTFMPNSNVRSIAATLVSFQGVFCFYESCVSKGTLWI